MKDEIKEILEEFESLFEVSEAPEYIIKDFNKIKDYITNLQEENKKLKHNLEQMYNNTKDTYNEICAEQIDYKSRCEKAIEKFKKAFDYRDNISVNNWEYDGGEEEYIEMLESAYNILQGSDKDEK